MAKKEKTRDELKVELKAAREESTVAKDELRAFEKENKLAKGEDHSDNKEFGKKWKPLKAMYDKKKAAVDSLKEQVEAAKPEKKERATVYTYPKNEDGSEMTAKDKKKFRAQKRAEKKKAEKGEAAPKDKKDKKDKKVKEGAATTETGEVVKKKKKKVKSED